MSFNYLAYIFVYFDCTFVNLLVYLYYSVYFSIILLYCIAMQPGTIISFGINKVLSYLILCYHMLSYLSSLLLSYLLILTQLNTQ